MSTSPKRSIPPLNALRTFVMTARHESFSAAAAEMHVTPGAISRQIQTLEDFLKTSLFERSTRTVKLTEEGRHYYAGVAPVFEQIAGATREIAERQRRRALHISSSMTFVLRWLVPRLPAFHSAHSDSEVMFSTSLKPVEFGSSGADIAIRIGTGDWPSVISEKLMGIELVPVCSPALLKGLHPLRQIADLAHHSLLHSSIQPDHWADWLQHVGCTDVDARRGLMFESVSLAYQAAIEGVGIAMGQLALVADDLASGRLVSPFGQILPTSSGFYLIYPERMKRVALFQSFRQWILAQAQEDQLRLARQFKLPAS